MKVMITRLACIGMASFCMLAATGQEMKNEPRTGQMKPEIRRMDPVKSAAQLRNHGIMTKADYVPFPDSTVTYDLKGEPVGKELYLYNERGSEVSYKASKKDATTGNWYETAKRTTTYDSNGNSLSYEGMIWDEAKKSWIGDYKQNWSRNSSGEMVLYEYYVWDSQNNDWKGETKYTYDYETEPSRDTNYRWNTATKSWELSKRTQYISSTLRYEEYWNSVDGKWNNPWKIEIKNVVDYDQAGLSITISEERQTYKLDNGQWNEENTYTTIRYSSYAPYITGWNAWNYIDYKVSYDTQGNIIAVDLIDGGDDTFVVDFTYDYAINKVNSAKVYDEGKLIDDKICIYDELGRIIEITTHCDYPEDEQAPKRDTKYAYTYVGDSETINSTEYYLWDESKKVFVSQSKDMYIRNANEQNTMHQTYSWAETKWVLSSYTIYYPNEYTSDLEIEELEDVGSDNKGSFEVGFNLPQDAEVTGSFYITFPKGFVLDEENTVLSEALRGKYAISVRKENETTWFVEIKESSVGTRSLYAASSYKNILTVAYKADEETKKGEYTAAIKNLNFILSDGTVLIEQEREVGITVDRFAVANEEVIGSNVGIFTTTNTLMIDTPDAETIHVCRISGELMHSASKTAGEYTVATGEWPKGIYIVTGGKGWTEKVLIK